MKSRIVILGLAAGLCLGAINTRATLEVSAGVQIIATADFYTPLAADGAWVDVHPYGRCWHPAHIAADWRPYCNGEWVWTDCGWYWQSDEPWAWACYHYGSWTLDPALGWVWVPGIEWAPAWVYWRTGGGYIGWAPCAPHGVVIAPDLFAFVSIGHFHDRIRPSSVIVRNQEIIRQTTRLNDVRRETRDIGGRTRQVVYDKGPGVDPIQKATGKEIKPVPVTEADRRTHFPSTIMRRTSAPNRQERPVPPLNDKSFRKEEAAPTRGVNPAAPNEERPRKEEIAPRRHGVISTPRANEQVPHKLEITPPARNVVPAPPTHEPVPRKQEVNPPPPANARLPRPEHIAPTPARPPITIEPRHEAPAEQPRPAEQPKGEGKHDKEP